MKKVLNKKLIQILCLSFLYLINHIPISLAQEVNKTEETTSINTTIPSLVFTSIGLLLGLTVTGLVIVSEPKSLLLTSETFVLKQKNLNTDSQTVRLSNLFGLNYKFGDFMELQPAVAFSSNMPNLYSLDLGVNLNNNNIIEKERFGISPFISFGLNANAYSLVNLGYGFYGKTGLTLKFNNMLVDFLVGYRTMETALATVNSLTIGGNLGYKF